MFRHRMQKLSKRNGSQRLAGLEVRALLQPPGPECSSPPAQSSLEWWPQEALRAPDLPTDLVASRWGLGRARVHQGLVVSGDRFVSSHHESLALRQELPQALAVEMECAAVAQVCHDFGVRFAAVRTISDRADASAATDFNRFLTEVASPYSAAIVTHCVALM